MSRCEDTLTLRGSLERESLRLAVVNLPTTVARYAWISSYLAIHAGSGIIYALTVEETRLWGARMGASR
jgi:ATP-dependent DNA helicase RecQ